MKLFWVGLPGAICCPATLGLQPKARITLDVIPGRRLRKMIPPIIF